MDPRQILEFVTLRMLGVPVRMLLGFIGEHAVAFPILIILTFWPGSAATLFRVVPLLLSVAVTDPIPTVGGRRRAPSGSRERWPSQPWSCYSSISCGP